MDGISLLLTCHNKADLLRQVLLGIFTNHSRMSKEFIIVFDGCTDNSEVIFDDMMGCFNPNLNIKKLYADDVWEVKANNIALKASECDYCLLIQDDMAIREPDFDEKLLKPFNFLDVIAVSAFVAHNDWLVAGNLEFRDQFNSSNHKGVFGIRDVCVRGPLMLDHQKLESLNYLNESYAPLTFDDHDLCLRAWENYGWVSGAYWIDYESRPEWGTTRQKNQSYWQTVFDRNQKKITLDHRDYFYFGMTHNEERVI